MEEQRVKRFILVLWLRKHLKALLLGTEVVSCKISWDLRICSALQPATEDGNASGLFGSLQRLLGKLCFTSCSSINSAVWRKRRGRNRGPPSSGATNVSQTRWGRGERGISITAASGTCNPYRARGQNHRAPNLEHNGFIWSWRMSKK